MPSSSTPAFLPSPQSELTLFRTAYTHEQSRLRHQSHLASISEARALITSIIHSQWPEHLWPSIKITCHLSMPELRDIAYLRRPSDGTRACGRLVRAPVVHEQVAEGLWGVLSAQVGGYGEGEEQEDFEREVVERIAEEARLAIEEDRRAVEQKNGRIHDSTPYHGRRGKVYRNPPDQLKQEVSPCSGSGMLDGVVWQKKEATCPCSMTDEAATEEHSSDDHGSETSTEKEAAAMSSPSTSTSCSSRISLSQVFAWGRRV